MAIFHDPIYLPPGASVPSLGVLIGGRVSSEVFESVEQSGYRSYFGSDFDTMTTEFFNRHVKPMDELSAFLAPMINAIENPDRIRMLTSFDDFRAIPPCMELPIAMFAPVRKGIEEGRLDGFGFIPETLPEEDVFGRLIDNDTCEDVYAPSDSRGYYTVTSTTDSLDPDLTDDELYAIRMTREYILNKILRTTDRDPTCIDLARG